MLGLPESNWLNALNFKASSALAAAIAAASIYLGAEQNFLHLGTLPFWSRMTAGIVAIFAGSVVLGRLIDHICGWVNRIHETHQETKKQAEKKKRIIAEPDDLNDREREILSFALLTNQKSFTAGIDGEKLTSLMTRGLVVRQSGVYSVIKWPYFIPDFVWDAMKDRRQELSCANPHSSPPWSRFG